MRSMRQTKRKPNVFAYLGLPNPEQGLLKAQLTLQIYRIVQARKLTQAQAGADIAVRRTASLRSPMSQP
jgi:hypothetical protein